MTRKMQMMTGSMAEYKPKKEIKQLFEPMANTSVSHHET